MIELVTLADQSLREDAASVSSYLPILAVHSSKSEKLTEEKYAYTIPMVNKIVLIDGGKYELIGNEVNAVYMASRAKATQYLDGKFESVLSGTKQGGNPGKYAEWRQKAKNRIQGYKYGAEFLFYLPEFNKFATVFHGTDFERKVGSSIIMDALDEGVHTFILHAQATGPQAKYKRIVIGAKPGNFTVTAPDEEEAQNAVERFLSPPVFVEDPGDSRS